MSYDPKDPVHQRIVEILCKAFEDNKSVNYIVKQDALRSLRIRRLMEYAFKVCAAHGQVLLSACGNACSLVLYQPKKAASLQSLLWDLKLVFGVIGLRNVFKVMRREKLIAARHPAMPFHYLWFIGVDPEYQGMGKGSEMLDMLLADAMVHDQSLLLETSALENLPFYERAGLELYDELDLGYPLYFLRKTSN